MLLPSHLHRLRLALALIALGLTGASRSGLPACMLASPPHRIALVELYTSEGCSSCPPADRWLSALPANGFGADKLVALAMHVEYWNDLGWTDRFSKSAFSQRQVESALRSHSAVIFTPQVLLDGKDLRDWNTASRFASRVAHVNHEPASAEIRVRASLDGATLQIDGEVRALKTLIHDTIGAWVAIYENRLVTQVAAGENGGRTLEHDNVVRALLGPVALDREGVAAVGWRLPIGHEWNRAQLGVAAFAQYSTDGTVLQAVSASNCL